MVDLVETRHIAHVVGRVGAENGDEDETIVANQERRPGADRAASVAAGTVVLVVCHVDVKIAGRAQPKLSVARVSVNRGPELNPARGLSSTLMSKRHWTLNYYRAIKVMTRLVREYREKNRCGSSTRLCGTNEPEEHSRTALDVNISIHQRQRQAGDRTGVLPIRYYIGG